MRWQRARREGLVELTCSLDLVERTGDRLAAGRARTARQLAVHNRLIVV